MEWISVDKLPPQTGAYLITDGRMIGEGYWSPAIGCYSAIDRRRRTLFSTCGHAFDCGSMNTKCPASANTVVCKLSPVRCAAFSYAAACAANIRPAKNS